MQNPTAENVSVFGVFLVRIFPHSDLTRRDTSIHFESRKIRTRKTPNTDTFHALSVVIKLQCDRYFQFFFFSSFEYFVLKSLKRFAISFFWIFVTEAWE